MSRSEGNPKHHLRYTRLYSIWCDIKKRCLNPNYHSFDRYGGRGIKICEEWLNDPVVFYEWAMSNGYQSDLSIDRIDNDGDYHPANCRWVTHKINCNNRSNTIKVEWKGDSHSLQEWSDIVGVKVDTLYYRHKKGYTTDKLFQKGRVRRIK